MLAEYLPKLNISLDLTWLLFIPVVLSLALIEIYEKLSSLPISTQSVDLRIKQHAKCTVDV